jgi:hypothetical protein
MEWSEESQNRYCRGRQHLAGADVGAKAEASNGNEIASRAADSPRPVAVHQANLVLKHVNNSLCFCSQKSSDSAAGILRDVSDIPQWGRDIAESPCFAKPWRALELSTAIPP